MCRPLEWMSLNGCIPVRLAMSSKIADQALHLVHGILVVRYLNVLCD